MARLTNKNKIKRKEMEFYWKIDLIEDGIEIEKDNPDPELT